MASYMLYYKNVRFKQTSEISHFIKALRLRQQESSDSLFPIFRNAFDLFTLSLPFARHVLHGVQSCETSTKHPRSARGNFIPIRKITLDELPMEQGVYGGCLLCPLYPLLPIANLKAVHCITKQNLCKRERERERKKKN